MEARSRFTRRFSSVPEVPGRAVAVSGRGFSSDLAAAAAVSFGGAGGRAMLNIDVELKRERENNFRT